MQSFRRGLILAHRYLGIPLSALFVVWFASGITMMYAGGMPRLTPDERIDRLPPIDLGAIRLMPEDAAKRAGKSGGRTLLATVTGRPAYRFTGRDTMTIFADNGESLDGVNEATARGVAASFMNVPVAQVHYVKTIARPDQWTLGQGRQMPLHKLGVDDALKTELYVSANTADVTMMTTRRSRALAWMGTIPHWLYLSALRNNQPLWYRVVVWTSGLGCVVAILGLLLGITQYRRSRPKPSTLAAAIPYSGLMRWHYVTGVVFGVFTLTWVFSGLLSMEPFGWATQPGLQIPRDAFASATVDLSRFPAMDPQRWARVMGGRPIKEIEFARIQGAPYYVVRTSRALSSPPRPERLHQPYGVTGRAYGTRILIAADTLTVRDEPFSVFSLVALLRRAVPTTPILEAQLLDDYDSYYYSKGRQTPLPILRVKFADPDRTWVYVDPEMSQVVARVHRVDRVERWLYNGLHSLDFSFLYPHRPLWDIVMLTLLAGGLASTAIGLVVGVKRIGRATSRAASSRSGIGATAVSARAPIRLPRLLTGQRPTGDRPPGSAASWR